MLVECAGPANYALWDRVGMIEVINLFSLALVLAEAGCWDWGLGLGFRRHGFRIWGQGWF